MDMIAFKDFISAQNTRVNLVNMIEKLESGNLDKLTSKQSDLWKAYQESLEIVPEITETISNDDNDDNDCGFSLDLDSFLDTLDQLNDNDSSNQEIVSKKITKSNEVKELGNVKIDDPHKSLSLWIGASEIPHCDYDSDLVYQTLVNAGIDVPKGTVKVECKLRLSSERTQSKPAAFANRKKTKINELEAESRFKKCPRIEQNRKMPQFLTEKGKLIHEHGLNLSLLDRITVNNATYILTNGKPKKLKNTWVSQGKGYGITLSNKKDDSLVDIRINPLTRIVTINNMICAEVKNIAETREVFTLETGCSQPFLNRSTVRDARKLWLAHKSNKTKLLVGYGFYTISDNLISFVCPNQTPHRAAHLIVIKVDQKTTYKLEALLDYNKLVSALNGVSVGIKLIEGSIKKLINQFKPEIISNLSLAKTNRCHRSGLSNKDVTFLLNKKWDKTNNSFKLYDPDTKQETNTNFSLANELASNIGTVIKRFPMIGKKVLILSHGKVNSLINTDNLSAGEFLLVFSLMVAIPVIDHDKKLFHNSLGKPITLNELWNTVSKKVTNFPKVFNQLVNSVNKLN